MTIDKQALRQIAESVDREEWDVLDNGDADYQVIVSGSLERGATYRSYQPVTNEISNKKIAAFIAAFNPKVALALLDENLQLQRDKDSLEAAAIAMRDDMREAREKLESAENNLIDSECHVAELEESLRDKQALLEAAEKAAIAVCNRSNHWKERAETAEERIAELEARTTGSETSFTFDAFEASGFAKGGWSVQEYVEIERYQAAVTGNSPVATDGLCPCCGRKPLKHIKCSVPGCGRKHVAHGLCQRHYDMKRREDPEQVEKFREANRRFTAKKRAQKTSAPQQEVKNG